jgi:hypothetical protein
LDTQERLNLWDGLEDSGLVAENKTDLAAKVNYLQTLEGGPQGYRLRRIILCNFWLYGIQEFEIPHGRLFLAGENASGKSSVLAAALPLALDGNISPNRLDTFGTRQRKIDYYVLGSAESSTPYLYDRRTTYIMLEFEWCNPANPPYAPEIRQRWLEARSQAEKERTRWLTIGISLAGNVNAGEKVRPLRFVVTDGSRFGYDWRVVDRQNVAYDHPAFKRVLSEDGRGMVCDTVADYQSVVARYLFNIEDVRDFQNIINMILVIRQPNLGTEINFTRVHDYLKQALPRIPEDITRRVTGTLERIDSIQNQLEHLQEAYDAASALDKAAQKLALAGARRTALTFLKARSSEYSFQGRVTSLEKERAMAESELAAAQTRYAELSQEDEEVAGQLAALESSESMQLAEKVAAARTQATEAQHRLAQQTHQLENARSALQTAQARRERLVASWQRWQTEDAKQLGAMVNLARQEAEWELAAGQLEEVARSLATLNLNAPNPPELPLSLAALAGSLSEERVQKLIQLEELHRERESKAAQARNATERAAEKREEYDAIRRQREEAQQAVTETREALAGEWRRLQRAGGWLAEFPDYRLAAIITGALRASLEEYATLAQEVVREANRRGNKLDEDHSRLMQQKGAQQIRLAELEGEYRRKQQEPDRLPLRTDRRQSARELLNRQGIQAYPFYALLDFVPGLAPEEAARVEQFLEDAGLLDALVAHFKDSARALALLVENKLSDTFIKLPAGITGTANSLANWLAFDPASVRGEQSEWELIVSHLLRSLPLTAPGAGNLLEWQQGWLAGQVGEATAPGYVGVANRERLRLAELAALEKRLATARAGLAELEKQIGENRHQRQQLTQEQSQLDALARGETIARAEAERNRLETERQRAERVLNDTQNTEREIRQELNGLVARLLQESAEIPGAANDPRRGRAIRDATLHLKNEAAILQHSLASAVERWQEAGEARLSLEAAQSAIATTSQLQSESQALATRAQAELAELEKLTETADWQQLVERLAYLRERRKALPAFLQAAAVDRGKAEERLRNLAETLEGALQNLEEARQKRVAAQTAFAMKLAFYPANSLIEARALDERGDTFKAANLLLRERENEPLPGEEELEADYNRVAGQLLSEFNKQRPFLAEYGPDLDEESRIVFVAEDQVEPPALLNMLANQIEVQRTLLDKEERVLFEDFLLQEMAEAIRSHITGAEAWVSSINQVLHNLPMVGERYALEWKPLEATEIAEGYGNHIARHHRLLSKPVQELSPEESQLILDALRREIGGLRLRQKDEPGLNFMDALVQIFDYREWFRFGIFITPQGGSRLRLTDRNAGTRSGAEQLFALYVPLFAALAALYGSRAAPGSPRLLALDEAFDKASLANTQKIMQFLVLQGFQWIMTGPQVSGTGSGVPVSAEYQMLHEKGTKIATSVPFYWIGGKSDL